VGALGEFGGGEEFGVATGAVARTQEVEEALLADGDGCWGGCWLLVVGCWLGCGDGLGRWGVRFDRRGHACGLEGLEGYLEGVDHLAGAAGVDSVFGEALDEGGEGEEDGGAVLDGGQLHAGDLGVDEDALLAAFGVLEMVVIAVVLAFEGGRAATLAGWGLVVVAGLVASEVWNWRRHSVYPPGYRFTHNLPNKPLTGY